MLEEFTDIWGGHLGTIKTVKHRIDLDIPEAKPVHSAPYSLGLAAKKLEKTEIKKMLRLGVIEQTKPI